MVVVGGIVGVGGIVVGTPIVGRVGKAGSGVVIKKDGYTGHSPPPNTLENAISSMAAT